MMIDARQEGYEMSEPVEGTEAAKTASMHPAVDELADLRQDPRAISHPREVTAVVMAQIHLVNAKKDELTIAMKGLTDLTQQLARAYAGQVQFIEQLVTRMKALEETVGTNGRNGQAAVQAHTPRDRASTS
jgi:hypothetical protein